MRSVVLLSGGLDSTVSLMRAREEGEVVLALTFDYGQRAAEREIAAAKAMCERLGVAHRVIALPWLGEITSTALVNQSAKLPQPAAGELEGAKAQAAAQAVWVPNRNGLFIAIAAAFAEAMGADQIVTGFNAEEAAAFPDNSVPFVEATNAALALSTLSKVRVVSYTQELDKAEIVRLGQRLGAPLDLIWSCYTAGPQPCGVCDPCLRFQRAVAPARQTKA